MSSTLRRTYRAAHHTPHRLGPHTFNSCAAALRSTFHCICTVLHNAQTSRPSTVQHCTAVNPTAPCITFALLPCAVHIVHGLDAQYIVWTPVQGLAAVKRQTGLERMYPPAPAPASRGLNLLRPLKRMRYGDIRGETERLHEYTLHH